MRKGKASERVKVFPGLLFVTSAGKNGFLFRRKRFLSAAFAKGEGSFAIGFPVRALFLDLVFEFGRRHADLLFENTREIQIVLKTGFICDFF